MAKAKRKTITPAERSTPREEQFADLEDRRPPYFGEREPVAWELRAHLLPSLHTQNFMKGIQYVVERLEQAKGVRFVERFVGWQQRRRPQRDSAGAVAQDLWPPDGKPPPGMSTPRALQVLGDECQHRGIDVHPDTLRRVIDRR
jgi:hypothetical protein